MNKIILLIKKFFSLFHIDVSLNFPSNQISIKGNKKTKINNNKFTGVTNINKNEESEIEGNEF